MSRRKSGYSPLPEEQPDQEVSSGEPRLIPLVDHCRATNADR